jgi:hypothetical protein
MFLKRIVRRSRGKTLSYWALVESYRTARGPRHRVVSYLGELTPMERKNWAAIGAFLAARPARSDISTSASVGENRSSGDVVAAGLRLSPQQAC